MKGPDTPGQDETLDSLSCGKLWVLQKKDAYRFSLDAYLLAAFVDERPGASVLEIGSGCGVVTVMLAAHKHLLLTGIEVQQEMAEMSARSVTINGLDDRVRIVNQDVRSFSDGPFDAVVANPPYRPLASGRLNSDPARAISRHEIMLDLETMIKKAFQLLSSAGRLYVIYPAWRLVDLFSAMRTGGIEPKRMRMVHSGADCGGELVLVCGVKNGGRELKTAPPLYVYMDRDVYSDEMRSIFADLRMTKTD